MSSLLNRGSNDSDSSEMSTNSSNSNNISIVAIIPAEVPQMERRPTIERPSHLLHLANKSKDFRFVMEFVELDKDFDNEDLMIKLIIRLIQEKRLIESVNYIIKEEIHTSGISLLREESVGSMLLKSYWFNFEGKDYISKIVGPLVKSICKKSKHKSLEIDPSKIDDQKAKKNMRKLLKIIRNFLNQFFHSSEVFPNNFDKVLSTLYTVLTVTEGAHKSHLGLGYSEDALRLFGGFLLLRFICPPIVSPLKYGLIKEKDMTANVQRSLIFYVQKFFKALQIRLNLMCLKNHI